MRCGNCGKQIPSPGGRCPHCRAGAAQQAQFHSPAKKAAPKSPTSSRIPAKKKPKEPRKKQPRSKILLVLMLFWCIVAVGLFSMFFAHYSDMNRYQQVGEEFVQALVLRDDATVSKYLHQNMRGSLRPPEHDGVTACQVQGRVTEAVDATALQQELSEGYGVKGTVAAARWILVEYTIESDGAITHHAIEVLLANIGGDLYAVKTRTPISN